MATPDPVGFKIQRLRAGEAPRVLDLFSGCGGLSLGFSAAGFMSVAGVESDLHAAASYGQNFHPSESTNCECVDISVVGPANFVRRLGWSEPETTVDVIVGGPPCQAFARIGRPKLADIAANPRAFLHDPRARLYLRYLEYVDHFKPLALLMENVPDAMNHGGQNVAAEICEVLDRDYTTGYTLLNAARYGVPQMRERLFLVAYRRELSQPVRFPVPSHDAVLPQGYQGIRHVALKTLNLFDLRRGQFLEPPPAPPMSKSVITVKDAVGDLPVLLEHLPPSRAMKAQRPPELPSPFGVEMRCWPGFEAPPAPVDHVTRRLPRDWPIFERMQPGDQYPQAHSCALQILAERAREEGIAEHEAAFEELRSRVVPPYSIDKFADKWRKLREDMPAHTLTAHLGRDTYSHIHYDDRQARTITVREAARLQSFPDGFTFFGGMNAAFRQIGNAVPPLLAKAIATTMLESLRAAVTRVAQAVATGVTVGDQVPVAVVGDAGDGQPSLDIHARGV